MQQPYPPKVVLVAFSDYRFGFLNDNPCDFNEAFNTGMDAGPMKCQYFLFGELRKFFKTGYSFVSSARLAGPERMDRKPSDGFLASSHVGQVGQSLLLKNLCPLLQILKPIVINLKR